jgi:large repetitive protein
VNAGTYAVRASFAGNTNYTSAYKDQSITITQATPTVNVSWNGGVYNGNTFVASATATGVAGAIISTPALTLAYYSGNTASGTPLAGAPVDAGTYTVRANFAGNTNYTSAYKDQSITIIQATPTVNVAWSGGVYSGNAFVATATVTGVGGATISTPAPTFAYYSGNTASGTPLAGAPLNAGTYTVRASFAGNANYTSAYNDQTITINKAQAEIAFGVPAGDTTLVQAFTGSPLQPKIYLKQVSPNPVPPYPYPQTNPPVTVLFHDGDTYDSNGPVWTLAPSAIGVYTVKASILDPNFYASDATAIFVIYDASAGFVTGGGWINSPGTALSLYGASLVNSQVGMLGKAHFGFESKYQKGAQVPTGQTEFQFQAGNLKFKSVAYEWLVVSGMRAQYKGTGTINGSGNYGFMLSAIDGGNTDKFRIKIWDATAVIYDNQMDALESADPSTVISGSIVIKAK